MTTREAEALVREVMRLYHAGETWGQMVLAVQRLTGGVALPDPDPRPGEVRVPGTSIRIADPIHPTDLPR